MNKRVFPNYMVKYGLIGFTVSALLLFAEPHNTYYIAASLLSAISFWFGKYLGGYWLDVPK